MSHQESGPNGYIHRTMHQQLLDEVQRGEAEHRKRADEATKQAADLLTRAVRAEQMATLHKAELAAWDADRFMQHNNDIEAVHRMVNAALEAKDRAEALVQTLVRRCEALDVEVTCVSTYRPIPDIVIDARLETAEGLKRAQAIVGVQITNLNLENPHGRTG